MRRTGPARLLLPPFVFFLSLLFVLPFRAVAGEEAVVPEELDRAILRAALRLAAQCDGEGRFQYRTLTNLPGREDGGYNTLRHAGALYALCQAYGRVPRSEIESAARRGAQYFVAAFLRPLEAAPGALAVWSPEEELSMKDRSGPAVAKLGGVGIGLVGLTGVENLWPGTVGTETLRGLARSVRFFQREDGFFHSKYYADKGFDDSFRSLYYPGEAIFGLARLHGIDPNPEWLALAARGMAYLARERAAAGEAPPDHWALLATEALLNTWDKLKNPPLTRENLGAHARLCAIALLADRAILPEGSLIPGCATYDGRTTPTATRLEGLLAAWQHLPPSEADLRAEIGAAARSGMSFLLRCQLRDGELEGAMPRAYFNQETGGLVPGLDSRAREVRIDYTQHALSAWIAYAALRAGEARDAGPGK